MSSVDLVVTDLDGTLWDHDVQVHRDTRRALDELARAKIPVLAATGRRKGSVLRGFAQADLSLPAVTVNGAHGFVPASADTVELEFHRKPFEAELAVKVLEVCRRFGHVPVAYNADGTAHVSDDTTTSDNHVSTFTTDDIRASPGDAAKQGGVVGFSLIGLETRNELEALGAALRGVGVQADPYEEKIYGGWSISAQPPGVTKWLGVERYCAFAGLHAPRVLALGDGGNDVELLRRADVALGVAGGDPMALAVSDRTVPPPESGGWAAVLDYI